MITARLCEYDRSRHQEILQDETASQNTEGKPEHPSSALKKKTKKNPTDYYYRDLFKSLEGLVGVLSRLKVLVDVLFCAVGELIAYLCFMVFSQFMVYRMTSVVTVPHTPAHLRLRSPLRRSYRNWYTHTHTDTHTYKS